MLNFVKTFKLNIYILPLLAQYSTHLYSYLIEWRKNPQWSFACCLALVLPLSDLQGEISGMMGTNVLDNQLQTGQTDMPTIIDAVKDSGAMDVIKTWEKVDKAMIT